MAEKRKQSTAGRNRSRTGKSSSAAKVKTAKRTASGNRNRKKTSAPREFIDYALYLEIILWILLAFSVLTFLSFFGVGGAFGKTVSDRVFGLFGSMAYLLPFMIFFLTAFLIANPRSRIARIKSVACVLLFIVVCGAMQMILVGYSSGYELSEYYEAGRIYHTGGGFLGGLILWLLCPYLGTIGTAVILAFLAVILLILITQRSIFRDLRRGTGAVARRTRAQRMEHEQRVRAWKQKRIEEREKEEELLLTREQERAKEAAARNTARAGRNDTGRTEAGTAVSGTAADRPVTQTPQRKRVSAFFRDIILPDLDEPDDDLDLAGIEPQAMNTLRSNVSNREAQKPASSEKPKKRRQQKQQENEPAADSAEPVFTARISGMVDNETGETKEQNPEKAEKASGSSRKPRPSAAEIEEGIQNVEDEIRQTKTEERPGYVFPSLDLLSRPSKGRGGTSREELMQTAVKLEEVLESFGVRVKVSDVSCGPAVTRFEMTPEQGVKVNKVLSLQNDIQLDLAAESLRIEAPIPGKAAIGIEIPNREKNSVLLREVLESDTFRKSNARIPYGVGKDIAGKIIVSDIHKMPHLLVAGATGSGKSVFINTLILSILYKAKPDEVKMIMVDPKVVELSVYNGIPHLLIPVVTDPKKAAGALNWAVAEMDRRYKLFATVGVREIRGYNQHVDAVGDDVPEEDRPARLPMIVIIVDELADLMMVAGTDVEDAICRLTQLARAAGIHLVIATQRPSVDVITGLIKANMPSRIAFSVSSGVDSRTILDQVGAEKLLGNGDMLFFPQSFKQPVRVQGAFVDDDEVASIVDFIKEHNGGETMEKDLSAAMEAMEKTIAGTMSSGGGSDQDELFAQAGKFIIEKDKASIGMLQRWFKIGFNRAARIMDQLSEAGVVGPEEGTKPRRVEMSMEQFENYLEQNG